MEQNIKNLYSDFKDKGTFIREASADLCVGEATLKKFFVPTEKIPPSVKSKLERLHTLAVNYHRMELEKHQLVHAMNK